MSVYANHFSPLILLFNGLDKCSNLEEFLRNLEEITGVSNSKVILLSRQHIYSNLSKTYFAPWLLVHTTTKRTLNYVFDRTLHGYSKRRASVEQHSIDVVISEIGQRTNSIFL
jgi:hypothetical protein